MAKRLSSISPYLCKSNFLHLSIPGLLQCRLSEVCGPPLHLCSYWPSPSALIREKEQTKEPTSLLPWNKKSSTLCCQRFTSLAKKQNSGDQLHQRALKSDDQVQTRSPSLTSCVTSPYPHFSLYKMGITKYRPHVTIEM